MTVSREARAIGVDRERADYRVAIVGARGLLGRALQRHAPPRWAILAPERLAAAPQPPMPTGPQTSASVPTSDDAARRARGVVDLDAPDTLASFLDAHPCDAVVLSAAWTAVDACEADPARALRVNGEAPGRMAEIAAARGLSFVFVSTDYVFDGSAQVPYGESEIPRPQSVYAQSKRAGELAVARAYAGREGLLIVRTSGLYGAGGPDFVHAVAPRLPGSVKVVTDQVLAPTWVDDLAPALWSLLASEGHGLFHLTSAGSVSWFDFARRMAQHLGFDAARVQPTTTAEFARPAARPAFSVLDCQRAESMLGRSMPTWETGLERFLRESGEAWRFRPGPRAEGGKS